MDPRRRFPAWASSLALVALAALATFGADRCRRTFWTTSDEAGHVDEARFLRAGGKLSVLLGQPGGFLLLVGAATPEGEPPGSLEEIRGARRPFPFVLGALVLVSGLWARRLAGPVAGVSAAAILAADPSLRGHAALVKADVGLALLFVAAVALLDVAFREKAPSRRLALLGAAGLTFGLAMSVKATALAFLPIFVAAALVRRALAPGDRRPGSIATTLLMVAPAFVGLVAIQEAAFRGVGREDFLAGARWMYRTMPERAPLRDAVLERAPLGVAGYVLEVDFQARRGRPGKWFNYLFGRVSPTGSPLYYPVALAVKHPVGAVALAVSGGALTLVVLLGRRASRRRRRRVLLNGAWPAGVGAAFVALLAAAPVQIGIRYAFPAVVLFVVAASAAIVTAGGRSRVTRLLLAACAAAAILESAFAFGREISFGNRLAGGTPGLRRILSDSNVDWGQEQGEIFARVAAGGLGRAGVVAPVLDLTVAGPLGIRWVSGPDESLDAVFVSAFYADLARALERWDGDPNLFPWYAYVKSWLCPLVRELERRRVGTERVGTVYELWRLAPPDRSRAKAP